MLHWLMTVTGLNEPGDPWYNFWSGFAGDIVLFGSILTIYRHHKCSTCWRIAHHSVQGTHLKTCHKHLTKENHLALQNKHASEYPEQNEMLNKDFYER